MKNRKYAEPIQLKDRITELDTIRGLAILGILLVNMKDFDAPMLATHYAPLWTGAWDMTVYAALQFLVQGKFYTMFSFLFGIGMVIFLERAERKGHPSVRLFLRRMGALLLIGAVHAFLIWAGDILLSYAICGFVLLLFRKAKPVTLLCSSVFVWFLPLIFNLSNLRQLHDNLVAKLHWPWMIYPPLMYPQEFRAYSQGSYWDMVVQRWHILSWNDSYFYLLFPPIFAMFLLGVYAGRRKLFQDIWQHLTLFRRVWLGSLIASVLFTMLKVKAPNFALLSDTGRLLYAFAEEFANPSLCLFYITSITLLMQQRRWAARLAPFAAVGRMAISNYIGSSVICTTLFYHYGFDLYGKVSPTRELLFTGLVYTLLMVTSILWSKKFRYGPLEWVWRSMTYGYPQPMRLQRNNPMRLGEPIPKTTLGGN